MSTTELHRLADQINMPPGYVARVIVSNKIPACSPPSHFRAIRKAQAAAKGNARLQNQAAFIARLERRPLGIEAPTRANFSKI